MKDKIDLNYAKAVAREVSMSFPKTKEERIIVMQKIGKALQDTHGSFFLDQVYDVLELVYEIEERDELMDEIDGWVENDEKIEQLGNENRVYTYRIE
ncbi:MAG: hypothetical protein QF475_00015 [Candidatus Undinarchaeales archaeon]|jgi:hypothetical protein|nr:hypothetical protein [Candidatus Undinarchaeales archaeon]